MYRVTFTNNEIAAIKRIEGAYRFKGDSMHYEYKGVLVYAFVMADSEGEARVKAQEIIRKLRRSRFNEL